MTNNRPGKMIRTSKTYLLLVCIISLLLLGACLSIKPGNSTSSGKYYETFFAGETGTQYYLKPTRFVNKTTREEAWPDITFRFKNVLKDSAIINISLLNIGLIKSADSMVINNGKKAFVCKEIKTLFTEKNKKFFHSRFSSKYSLLNVNDMFSNKDWVITVFSNQQKFEYAATNKTKKTIHKLNEDVIILFR